MTTINDFFVGEDFDWHKFRTDLIEMIKSGFEYDRIVSMQSEDDFWIEVTNKYGEWESKMTLVAFIYFNEHPWSYISDDGLWIHPRFSNKFSVELTSDRQDSFSEAVNTAITLDVWDESDPFFSKSKTGVVFWIKKEDDRPILFPLDTDIKDVADRWIDVMDKIIDDIAIRADKTDNIFVEEFNGR